MLRRLMPAAKPNVFNIPASAPFLPVLVDALRAADWCQASRRRTIRSNWRAPRSICRRGAPAGWRAMSSSSGSTATPRSCRASCRSAISTRTRSSLPKPPRLAERAGFAEGHRAARAPTAARRIDSANGRTRRGTQRRRLAAGRQHAAGGAGPGRRSRAPDGRHDDASGRLEKARRPGAGRTRRYWQMSLDFSRSRARPGRAFAPSAAPSNPPSGATS